MLLAALLAYAFAFVLAHYNFPAAPPSDFFSFRGPAASFAKLEVPDSFKRAPAFPAALALVRLVMPGPHPYLAAANLLNLLASAGVLALAYYWARPRLGRGAPLLVALVAVYSQFPILAALPLCEMGYLLFILAAVATAGRGTGWPYLWAGLAAATRYEALALIPLLALADLGRWRERPRLLLYAALAAFPTAAWIVGGSSHTASPNPYLEEIGALEASGAAFPLELAASVFDPAKSWMWGITVVLAAVTVVGFARIAARGGPGERVYLAFAAAYTVIHIIFPFSSRRFVFPIWPILAYGLVEGGRVVYAAAARLRLGRAWYAVGAAGLAAGALGLAYRLVLSRPAPLAEMAFAGVIPLAGLAACAAWAVGGREARARRWAGVGVAVLALALFVDRSADFFWREREALRSVRGSTRAAAEWLAAAAGPEDVIVANDPDLFRYYMAERGLHVRPPASFRTDDFGRFTREARGAGVSYVCYDSRSGRDPHGYFASRMGAPLLAPLAAGRDVGRYYFVGATRAPGEYVYIYRLAEEPARWNPRPFLPRDER